MIDDKRINKRSTEILTASQIAYLIRQEVMRQNLIEKLLVTFSREKKLTIQPNFSWQFIFIYPPPENYFNPHEKWQLFCQLKQHKNQVKQKLQHSKRATDWFNDKVSLYWRKKFLRDIYLPLNYIVWAWIINVKRSVSIVFGKFCLTFPEINVELV